MQLPFSNSPGRSLWKHLLGFMPLPEFMPLQLNTDPWACLEAPDRPHPAGVRVRRGEVILFAATTVACVLCVLWQCLSRTDHATMLFYDPFPTSYLAATSGSSRHGFFSYSFALSADIYLCYLDSQERVISNCKLTRCS